MFDLGTAVLAGGSLLGGMMSSNASSDAANAGLAANRLAQQQQKAMFDTQRADLAPWRSTGQQALGRLNELYGFSGAAPSRRGFTATTSDPNRAQAANRLMQMDPGYQFRLNEGKKALQNSLLARGGALSGSALKAGQRYTQNVASQEFGNAYNRLAGLANMGAGAAGQQAGFAGQYGNNMGNLAISSGNIAAQGAIGQGNAWQNAINQGMSLYGLKNGWGN